LRERQFRENAKALFKVTAGFLLLALTAGAVWLIYAPAHWLTPFSGAVMVDEHPVQADLYIGHPTDSEAEAIALVHVPGVGDYFLDFKQEKYREASSNEFVHFKRGVWTFAPMNEGRFVRPLPFRGINEFRLPPSNGHTVTVQF
jgi:hypothetical protein